MASIPELLSSTDYSISSVDKLHVRKLFPTEEPLVRNFLAGQPGATAFHDPDVLKALSLGFGEKLLMYGVFNDGNLENVTPIIEGRVWKGMLKGMEYSPWQYTGPVSDPSTMERDIKLLIRRLREDGIKIVNAGFSPWQPYDKNVFKHAGVYLFPDVAYPIKLAGKTESDVLAKMSQGTRKGINRIRRRGAVTLRPATIKEVREVFPLLSTHSFTHGNMRSPYSSMIFEALSQRLGHPSYLATTALYNGHIVGGLISVEANNRGYGLIIGKDYTNKENNQNTNAGLFWNAICWSMERGHAYYDPGGSGSESIKHFKKGLGGDETSAPRIKIITHPIVDFGWQGVRAAKAVGNGATDVYNWARRKSRD